MKTFVVLCGDALVDVDSRACIEVSQREKRLSLRSCSGKFPWEQVTKYGVVEVRRERPGILRFQEKPAIEEAVSTVINTGIYLFEPRVFDFIPSGQEFDIGGQLFPALVAANEALYGVVEPFNWLDIGSIPDFWEGTRLLLENQLPGFTLPGEEVRPGIHTGINLRVPWDRVNVQGPVYIGSGTEIGAGATLIGPSVVGSGCVLQEGATVRECILGDYTRVSSAAVLERKIISGGKCIDPNGQYLDINEAQIGWIVDDARKQMQLTAAESELWEQVMDHVMA